MNPNAILALIGELYETIHGLQAQIAQKDQRIAELEGQLPNAE